MTPMKWLAALLGVLGLIAVVVGILYFALPAHSLPSFLSQHYELYRAHHKVTKRLITAHRKRRGEAAVAIGVVLWVVGGIVLYVSTRPPKVAESTPTAGTPSESIPTADTASESAPTEA